MLVVASDIPSGCAVLIVGPPGGDAVWRAYVEAIEHLQTQVPRDRRPVLIQMLLSQTSLPSAVVRRELALLRQRIRADAVNAVVAQDASFRLMQTALDWIHRPHYASSTHADFGSALAQIEKVLGQPMPVLPRLYREATEQLRRPRAANAADAADAG